MSTMKQFFLPDLGEGLPDAEIVEWLAKEGELVLLDQPLVSMETAKAVVEVPSPFSGILIKQHGKAGDVIDTGSAIASFELDMSKPQRADAADTGHQHGPPKTGGGHGVTSSATQEDYLPLSVSTPSQESPPAPQVSKETAPATSVTARADEGTVVGAMQSSNEVKQDLFTSIGGIKAMPAVRALAKKMGVDLTRVQATGAEGSVSMQDVKNFAASPNAASPVATKPISATPPAQSLATPSSTIDANQKQQASNNDHLTPTQRRAMLEAEQSASKTAHAVTPLQAPNTPAAPIAPAKNSNAPYLFDQSEALRGVRRNMARVMAQAHTEVVPTTIVDDADIHRWDAKQDITVRLVRALVVACKAVPALNAWFDGANGSRIVHSRVDVGVAVDTDEGLFVPALRNADVLDAHGLRAAINRIRDAVRNRSIPAEELKGYTIMLSNFGVFAGRYATPVVVPPCVCIVASGKLRHEVVPVMGGIETHRLIPLSLTFDHRAATGGEAAKFLRAMLDDLGLAH